jgi:hypothetical protein
VAFSAKVLSAAGPEAILKGFSLAGRTYYLQRRKGPCSYAGWLNSAAFLSYAGLTSSLASIVQSFSFLNWPASSTKIDERTGLTTPE